MHSLPSGYYIKLPHTSPSAARDYTVRERERERGKKELTSQIDRRAAETGRGYEGVHIISL